MTIFPIKTTNKSTPHIAQTSERRGRQANQAEQVIGVFSLWSQPEIFRRSPSDSSRSLDILV